jgi:predicted cupin superfamily sugar epimerase
MIYLAEELIEKLRLEPHPEGGWFRFMWRSGVERGENDTCSYIYYMLRRGETSRWHKLGSSEIWCWHQGGSLEMTLGGGESSPIAGPKLRAGPRLDEGEGFQLAVPAGQWQTTRVVDGDFVLVSCIVAPAFRDEDCILPEQPLSNEIYE